MKYLDTLKDLRIYSMTSYKINALRKDIEDVKKGQLVLNIGHRDKAFEDLLNTDFLRKQNFKFVHIPRIYRTNNKRLRNIINQRDYIADLKKNVNRPLRIMRTPPSSQSFNLMIDLGKFVEFERDSLRIKNRVSIRDNFKGSLERFLMDHYDDIMLFINLDGISTSSKEALKTSNLSMLSTISTMIRREVPLIDEENLGDRKVTLVLASVDRKMFFKVDITDQEELNSKKALFRTRISSMLSMVNQTSPDDIVDDYPEEPDLEDEDDKEEEKEPEKLSKEPDKEPEPVKPIINRFRGMTNQEKRMNFANTSTITADEEDIDQKKKDEEVQDQNDEIDDKVDNILKDMKDDELYSTMEREDEDKIRSIIEKELKDDPDLILVDNEEIIKSDINSNEVFNSIKKNLQKRNILGNRILKDTTKMIALSNRQEEVLSKLESEKTLDDIEARKIDITTNDNIEVIDDESKKTIKVNDFDRSYMEKQFNTDFINNLKTFSDNENLPVYINDVKMEDTSNTQTSKNTVNVKFRDVNNINHSMTFDLPKLQDGKYMKINGSKKILTKQLFMNPIVKYKPNEVWITTNYNKFIIEKFGTKHSNELEWISNLTNKVDIKEYVDSDSILNLRKGNISIINNEYTTSVEYVNLSSFLLYISDANYFIDFNQKELLQTIEESTSLSKIVYDTTSRFPVGYNTSKTRLLVADFKDFKIYELTANKEINKEVTLTELVMNMVIENTDIESLDKIVSRGIKTNSKLTFSRVKITNRLVPIIMLLGFDKGLKNILERYNVDYKFTEKNERLKISDKKSKIKFSNGYLIYDNSKLRFDLLLSGLNVIATQDYTFEDMENIDPYLDYFEDKFHSRNVAKGFRNALMLMIDPITKEVLNDLDLPENITDLLLLANSMLEDVSASPHNDMSIYRLRGAEQINALVYQMLAQSFKEYVDTANNKNPKKMTVPKDLLMKTIMEQTTVDEVSDLNPSLEIDKATSATYKGVVGKNNDRSYTPDIRSYHESMTGILGISTPDSAKVGVTRQISYDSNIKSIRGYLDGGKEELTDTELFTPLELLNPFTSRHADKILECPL